MHAEIGLPQPSQSGTSPGINAGSSPGKNTVTAFAEPCEFSERGAGGWMRARVDFRFWLKLGRLDTSAHGDELVLVSADGDANDLVD